MNKTTHNNDEFIRDLREVLSGIATVREWHDRIYINPRGNGGRYRGESSDQLYILGGTLVDRPGRGATSRDYDERRAEAVEIITRVLS